MNKYERKLVEFQSAETSKAESGLHACRIAYEASGMGVKTWANDLAQIVHVTRQSVYDRVNAHKMRLVFLDNLDADTVRPVLTRGWSWLSVLYRYKNQDLIDLVEIAIESPNREAMSEELSRVYGEYKTAMDRVGKFSTKLTIFYGGLEYDKAPQYVRNAVIELRTALEVWQNED